MIEQEEPEQIEIASEIELPELGPEGFGIEGGPRVVEKDVIEHDASMDQVVETTDLEQATADLQAAETVEIEEDKEIIQSDEISIWTQEGVEVTNKEMLIETKGIEKAEKKYKRWMDIPGWLVITCQKSDDKILYQEDYAACCCVVQNLMLCLWEKGIGTKWSTGPVTHDDRFYDLIWVNRELENIVGLIWYGYPAEIPQTTRKPLQQVLTELP